MFEYVSGIVKTASQKTGYGFVVPDGSEDTLYFCLAGAAQRHRPMPVPGDRLFFKVVKTVRGTQAQRWVPSSLSERQYQRQLQVLGDQSGRCLIRKRKSGGYLAHVADETLKGTFDQVILGARFVLSAKGSELPELDHWVDMPRYLVCVTEGPNVKPFDSVPYYTQAQAQAVANKFSKVRITTVLNLFPDAPGLSLGAVQGVLSRCEPYKSPTGISWIWHDPELNVEWVEVAFCQVGQSDATMEIDGQSYPADKLLKHGKFKDLLSV